MLSISKISLLSQDPKKLWRDPHAKSISFFCVTRPVRIDAKIIEELKQISLDNESCNVRVCLHSDPTAQHQDMIILERTGRFYPPHRHEGKGECFHVIEGTLGVVVFSPGGEILESVTLKPGELLRIEEGSFHAVTPITEYVIYHENKPGPFTGSGDSILPDWAPVNKEEEHALVARIKYSFENFGEMK